MSTYYKITLVVFRGISIAWLFHSLLSYVFMALVSLKAIGSSIPSVLGALLFSLLMPIAAYFASPFLARLATRGID